MNTLKIKIKNKIYDVLVAETEEDKMTGLKNKESLENNEGMLFTWKDVQESVSFWMEDTKIPLDIIFIDEDLKVISIKEGIPYSTDFITEKNVLYVLELNKNSGIEKGDEIEFSPEMSQKMKVLKEDGSIQMELEGGERIFSRPNTKTLVKFAKKAYATRQDKDYKALGKRVFKFLDIQDSNEPEYVNE